MLNFKILLIASLASLVNSTISHAQTPTQLKNAALLANTKLRTPAYPLKTARGIYSDAEIAQAHQYRALSRRQKSRR